MLGIYRGHFEAAGALFTKLYDHAVRYESLQHQVWASLGKAASELRRGRPAEAAHVLERVLELLVDPDPAEQIQAYGLLACARWRQGEDARPRRRILGREPHDPKQAANRLLPVRGLQRGRRGPPRPVGSRRPLTRDQAARQACAALHTFARIFPIGKPRTNSCMGSSCTSPGRDGPGGLAGQPVHRPAARHAARRRARAHPAWPVRNRNTTGAMAPGASAHAPAPVGRPHDTTPVGPTRYQ